MQKVVRTHNACGSDPLVELNRCLSEGWTILERYQVADGVHDYVLFQKTLEGDKIKPFAQITVDADKIVKRLDEMWEEQRKTFERENR